LIVEELQIETCEDRLDGGSIVRSARLHRAGVEPAVIWHRFPVALEATLGEPKAEPWLLVSLLLAMRDGMAIKVDRKIDRRLLANLDEYQHAWERRSAFRDKGPVYRRVPIEAEPADRLPPADDSVVLAYSGGLDSTFSLVRHATGSAGPASRPLAGTVFVQGFDIGLADDAFSSALERARPLTEELQVPLWPVASNSRLVETPWPECYPCHLSAVLHQFDGSASGGMLASGRRWDWLGDTSDGGSPATDHLLGGRRFEIVHDGAGFDRGDKLALLADHPTALRNLRFCWAGTRLDRNCGECRKCVTTALYFRAVGLPATCFDTPPTDETVKRVLQDASMGGMTASYGEAVLAHADRNGVDEPWVSWLRKRLWRIRRARDRERFRNGLSAVARNLRPRSWLSAASSSVRRRRDT
jgi:hypothetical protein